MSSGHNTYVKSGLAFIILSVLVFAIPRSVSSQGTGITTRVSVASDGTGVNGDCGRPQFGP